MLMDRLQLIAQDHPRGCGENISQMRNFITLPGSPPRMRGKLHILQHRMGFIRITPADAGKTSARLGKNAFCWDHPRGCGENRADNMQSPFSLGSPPRMRGKPKKVRTYRPDKRITPADAGKTCNLFYRYSWFWDHPRGCGENLFRNMLKPH